MRYFYGDTAAADHHILPECDAAGGTRRVRLAQNDLLVDDRRLDQYLAALTDGARGDHRSRVLPVLAVANPLIATAAQLSWAGHANGPATRPSGDAAELVVAGQDQHAEQHAEVEPRRERVRSDRGLCGLSRDHRHHRSYWR